MCRETWFDYRAANARSDLVSRTQARSYVDVEHEVIAYMIATVFGGSKGH